MNKGLNKKVAGAKKAAIDVLINNFKLKEPDTELPKTSGWGYYEPYTRDLMIAFLGILITGRGDYEDQKDYDEMIKRLRIILEALAKIQTEHGHIPSMVNNNEELGASDTTPLFILAVYLFWDLIEERKTSERFLEEAVQKAKTWMEYQSPDDSGLVAYLHTTDWRDEMWGFHGFFLFVNVIVYSYLRLSDDKHDLARAEILRKMINSPAIHTRKQKGFHQGMCTDQCHFYAMCVFKPCTSENNIDAQYPFGKWFDLLGNSLAILAGIATPKMAKNIISFVEEECKRMQINKELNPDLNLPPNFFPFVQSNAPEWCPRYDVHGLPGNYQNGGIWPFVCGFYIAALVAAGEMALAEEKLADLTKLVKFKREPSSPLELESLQNIPFGFNEWFNAQNEWGKGQNKTQDESLQPQDEWFKAHNENNKSIMGHNWQTWSASMYLYAVKCVEMGTTPFFDKIRSK